MVSGMEFGAAAPALLIHWGRGGLGSPVFLLSLCTQAWIDPQSELLDVEESLGVKDIAS